jgi:hypothetical protein
MTTVRHPRVVELDTWEATRAGEEKRPFRALNSVHTFPDLLFPFQFLQTGVFSAGGRVTDTGATRKMEGKLSEVSRLRLRSRAAGSIVSAASHFDC